MYQIKRWGQDGVRKIILSVFIFMFSAKDREALNDNEDLGG